MNFNYPRVGLFFLVIGVIAFILLPSSFDLVTMYKRSYLFHQALEILDMLEVRYPGNARVMVERADVYYLKGQYEQADELLKKVTKYLPDDASAWRQLVVTRKAMLDLREVQAALAGLHLADPRDTETAFDLIALYTWHQELDAAAEVYADLTRIEPHNLDNWMAQSSLFLQMREPDSAAWVLQRAINQFPDRYEPVDDLAYTLTYVDRSEEAIPYYENLLQYHPSDTHILTGLSELYIQTARNAEAEELLGRALKGDPASVDIRMRLGELYLLDRPDLAVDVFRGVLDDDQGHERAIDRLVTALAASGSEKQALAEFRGAYFQFLGEGAYYEKLATLFLEINQETIAVQAVPYLERNLTSNDRKFLLSKLLFKQKKFSRALVLIEALVENQPSRAAFWQLRMDLYFEAKMGADFIAEAAVRYPRLPPDPVLLERLADAYEWTGAFALGLEICDRLILLEPSNPAFRQRRAYALYTLKDYEGSAREFSELVNEFPDSEGFRGGLVESARLMSSRSRAIEYVERAFVASRKTDTQSAIALAAVFEKAGRLEDALELYARMESIYPDNADILADIGGSVILSGDKERARGWFFRALKMDPLNLSALSGLADIYADEAPETALEYLKKIERSRPGDVELVYRIASVLDVLGRGASAVARYDQFLKLTALDKTPDVYRVRQVSHALYRTGRAEEALQELLSGQRRFPADKGIVNDIAELLIEQKRYDEAMLLLRTG